MEVNQRPSSLHVPTQHQLTFALLAPAVLSVIAALPMGDFFTSKTTSPEPRQDPSVVKPKPNSAAPLSATGTHPPRHARGPARHPDYRTQALSKLERLESCLVRCSTTPTWQAGNAPSQATCTSKSPLFWKTAPSPLINDQINTVLTCYNAFRRRDYTAALHPRSLIDFDEPSPSAASTLTNDLRWRLR
ncbi:hypothetical protein C8J57DRAFT_1532976 [Mycena rebaudengoi]|nr:hypothetical protein C8J57DRAFT_1532976 [Mycena rebaudengoi]